MLTRAYVVKRALVGGDWDKRMSGHHLRVFHGVSHYVNETASPPWTWRPPATTNDNREPVHVSRSGRFVPPVFGRRTYELLVSEEIRDRLKDVPHVEFTPVVFERLIDVPMPAVGDFSWVKRDMQESIGKGEDYIERDRDLELFSLPDVPEFHESTGPYYSLLAPNIFQVEDQYDDACEIDVEWGTYKRPGSGRSQNSIKLSQKLLEACPIIRSKGHVFRDDVFSLIAPFLDLDYYAIAVVHIGEEEPSPALDAYRESLRRSIRASDE